jgi:predicted PurR-regulated permease PerM
MASRDEADVVPADRAAAEPALDRAKWDVTGLQAPPRLVFVRPGTVAMVLSMTLMFAFALALVFLAWHVITWILIALFLALALNPAVAFFERRGLRRSLAATAVFLLALFGFVGIGLLFVPPLVREIGQLIEDLPELLDDLAAGRGPLGFLEREYQIVERVREAVESQGEDRAGRLLGLTAPVLTVVAGIATAVAATVSIAVMTFFMLLEGPKWLARLTAAVPASSRRRWERVANGIYRTISGYVSGNLLISLIAGISSSVVMLAVGVPYAVALGVLVAILDLVPLAGAPLAAIVVTAIGFTQGLVPGLVVLGFFIVYQQIENHVLQPLVYGRTVELSPLAVVIAILLGVELAGVLGALAAIPVAGSFVVVLRELALFRRERATASSDSRIGVGAP